VVSRPANLCNFLDAPEIEAFLGQKGQEEDKWRVVYRNYATLYFVFVVDGAESELGILDLIQVCCSKPFCPMSYTAELMNNSIAI
jgi:AP-3 complex subunit sigma